MLSPRDNLYSTSWITFIHIMFLEVFHNKGLDSKVKELNIKLFLLDFYFTRLELHINNYTLTHMRTTTLIEILLVL